MIIQSRRFSLAVRTPAALAGAPYAQLIAGTKDIAVREVCLVSAAATASAVGLALSTTLGTATTPSAGARHRRPSTVSLASVAIAWSVAPTLVSPAYYRKSILPATAFSKLDWIFSNQGTRDGDLIVPAGGSLLLWNHDGAVQGSALDVHFTWDEVA